MTTNLIDNMNLNCAVKLLRFDDVPTTSNNEAAVSVLSNNAGISNQPIAEIKRSSRISRKRTKPRTEDGNQSENVKKKKCMIKKPQLNKTESGKTDTPPKEPKKNKIRGSLKSNDDFSEISNTMTYPISFIDDDDDDEEIIPKKGSSKPAKFKVSKSIIAVKKKPIVLDVNNDNSINEVTKTDNSTVPSKSPKTKTLKSITSNRKKPVLSNVSKNNSSSELEESNNGVSTKTLKNKTPKSNIDNKKKSSTNNINDVDKLHELQVNKVQFSDNFVTPEVPKAKTSKSIVSNKKKPVVNTINKNGTTFDHVTSNKIEIPRKRARTSLKKEKCQKPNIENKFNNEDNLEQTPNSGKICKELDTDEELNLSQNFEDDTLMLRSTDNPPKIKKKWSDEWSGGKLVKNISKSNNEELSNDSTLDVNNYKTVKRISKTQKSKNSNSKKVKTKMLDQLNPEDSHTSITNSDNTNRSSLNVPVVQNDGISITFNIPLDQSIPGVCNDAVSNPVCNTLSSGTLSSNVSFIPTTVTDNSFSNKNVQQSHLSTLEPISDSDYLSVSTISPENPEMSYGMAILSEAISRQCRESANQQLKKKSPEPDTIDIQSCTKKANNTSKPQVPSAMVSPQRVVKNMSKKELKYSPELCLQSVENELESHSEYEIQLLSKRFNIPITSLRRTVVDEPLSVFRKKYSKSVTPSMVTISPIVKDADSKSGLNLYNYISGNIDVEYKLEPIREGAAYETNNLKDLMLELSKTMPSWSLSIVTNPPRYVISQMSIGKFGVPSANKCIVLDRTFRASVYINQSLEHKLCKRYTTATEIVNLIKELNSI
ncbi:MATH and LRR domain-containing protein PFE0570w-like [Aphis gossypii]|uniref:MATH and LRR domain-containing protein PFE0570w-like n=1 Tax=Aphis gossypii TaxID=80765 RepID=UPI002158EFFF|nr:MATH and LRR domain-containing protein PFE0570w-like [Aphis gossypii]XP_050059555.1 MATH and LRR domain-containing protein PFE0570w-like [Aphis gossypii]